MTLTLEHDFSGPHGSGAYTIRNPETGQSRRLEGKAAGLLAMLLADNDYELRDDFHPFSAFTEESLARGRGGDMPDAPS